MWKKLSISILSVLLFGSYGIGSVFPQALDMINGCSGIKWMANTEPDLAGYRIYMRENNTPLSPVTVGAETVTKACSELPFKEGNIYVIKLTAFDASGNESPKSDGVAFSWPDTTAPFVPNGVCLVGTRDGQPITNCLPIQ